MSGGYHRSLVVPEACVLVACMLVMTGPFTSDARAEYDLIDVFGSGEEVIDLNFTDWGGGYDNVSISVRMPKWSSARDADLNITGTQYVGSQRTLTIDGPEEWRAGTVNPDGSMSYSTGGFHLDANGVGLFVRPNVYSNGDNITCVDAADMYDRGWNSTLITDYGMDRVMISTRWSSGTGVSYYYPSSGPVVAKFGHLNVGNDTADMDFAVGCQGSQSVELYLRGGGGRGFNNNRTIHVGADIRDIFVSDVNNDSMDDVLVAAGHGQALVYTQETNGSFTKVLDQNLSSGGLANDTYLIRGCAAADLNGDGLNDTVWTLSTANRTGHSERQGFIQVCYQDASNNITMAGSRTRYAYTAAWGIDAGDINDDGLADVVVTNRGSSENLHVFYQDQQGDLSTARVIPCGVTEQGWPDIGDANADGLNDVAVGGMDGELTVLMQRSGQINVTVWKITTSSPVNHVAIADYNDDELSDLIIANSDDGTWHYYDQQDRFYSEWNSGPLDQPSSFDYVVAGYSIDRGDSTTNVYFSWDNSTWFLFSNGTRFNNTGKPTRFWFRITTSTVHYGDLDLIRYLSASMTPTSYPSNLALDVGLDGTLDWSRAGELTTVIRASRLEYAITAFLQDPENTPDGEGMVTVPIGIRTASAGYLRVHDLRVEYNNATSKPQLEYPVDGAFVDATPTFQFGAVDSNDDPILFKLQLTTTDFDDEANTTTFDLNLSRYNEVQGEGFSAGQSVSGATATFVLPARFALEDSVTYRWRVTGYDYHIPGEPSDARTITVDALAPEVRMTSPGYSTDTEFTVNWTAWDPSPGSGLRTEDTFDVEYRRSTDTTWVPWLLRTSVTQATFFGEEDTIYHFRMRAWDNVYNARPLAEGEGDTTTKVDTRDPTLVIRSPLEGEVVTDHTLELRVEARDGAYQLSDGMVEYRRDDLAWGAMTRTNYDPSVWEVTLWTESMGDGDHTVTFRVTDDVGHVVQASRDLVIDDHIPGCAIIVPLDDAMVVGPLLVQVDAWDALGIDHVEVMMTGLLGVGGEAAAYSPLTGYWEVVLNTTGYDEGRVQLSTRAWDTSGLVSDTVGPVTVRVDNAPPRLKVTEPTNGTLLEGKMKLVHVDVTDLYFDDSVDVVTVSFDGGPWTDMAFDGREHTLLWDMTGLADGEHTISASATDAAGHVSEVVAIVHVDNTPPWITIISPVQGQVISGTVTLDATVEDLYLDKAQADVDGARWTNIIDSELVIDSLEHGDGTHTITVWAIDSIGHETEVSIQVVFDNTPPALTAIDVPPVGARVAGEVPFVVSVRDANGLANLTVEVDGAPSDTSPVEVDGTVTWSLPSRTLPDGDHLVTLTFSDVASNAAVLTWSGVVDNTPPVVEVRSPGDEADGVVRFVVSVSDPSGVTSVQLSLVEGEWLVMESESEGIFVYEWSTDVGDNQDLRYSIRATDGLGNAVETGRRVEISNLDLSWVVAPLAVLAAVVILAVLVLLRRGGARGRL